MSIGFLLKKRDYHVIQGDDFMKAITADPNAISYCGLYCGACKRYLSEACPGCHDNKKASWCKVRSCNISNRYASCADCTKFTDVSECKDFNNFIAKIFGLIFRTDRKAGIEYIRKNGLDAFARMMAENGLQGIRKR